MSSMSPGITPAQKQPSSTTTMTLKQPEVTQALETFRLLIQSCYGPTGHLKTIQNSCGGQVTVTSSSSLLMRHLSLSRPLLRLIAAAVEGHVSTCSDGGLFCALLMTNLIKSCCELDVHPMLCIGINELMLKMSVEYLNSDDSCRLSIDVADAQVMLSLVRSVVATKPACGLSRRETDLICSLTLQAFLHCLPSSVGQSLHVPTVRYVLVEGRTPMESQVMAGVLIESPQIPTYTTKVIKPLCLEDGSISVALFNVSLAGGGEGFPDMHLETTDGVSLDDASLNQLLALGKFLIQQNIGLLACQKVVHPRLKHFLRSHNVMTIDRLSIVHIDAVQIVTGARVLGALQVPIPQEALGSLEGVNHCVMQGKSYLHLQRQTQPVCTYVLCNRTESSLEELKTVCSAANHILALALSTPLALPGGGCFEACLAAHLKQRIQVIESDILEDVGCSKSQFKMLANNFIHCVELVARAPDHGQSAQVTDGVHHHRWPLPLGESPSDWLRRCACGMRTFKEGSDWLLLGCRGGIHQSSALKNDAALGKKNIPEIELQDERSAQNNVDKGCGLVLDSFVAKLNGLRVAVETANVVLRIHWTIDDGSS